MNNYESLTPRQKEVLKLMAFGKRTSEIAKILVVSLTTIKTHIKDIYETLCLTESAKGSSAIRIKAVNIYWQNNPRELKEFKPFC